MHVTIRSPLRVITLAAALACTAAGASPPDDTLSVAELGQLVQRREAVHIYDANDRATYAQGHIPGARWVRYDGVATADLPPSTAARLVFYCWNPQCGASHIAAGRARELGYRNVWRLPEGISGWRAAGMPIESGMASATAERE